MDIGNVPTNPLTDLKKQIEEHWSEYFPNMTASLKASGDYESAVQNAVNLTKEAVLDYVSSHGGGPDALVEGYMLYRNEWALLESSEDQQEDNDQS